MAKPANWKRMSWDKKFSHASKLWASDRSEFLVAEALDIAIRELKKQRGARRQTSDIEDMEILREMIIGDQRVSVPSKPLRQAGGADRPVNNVRASRRR